MEQLNEAAGKAGEEISETEKSISLNVGALRTHTGAFLTGIKDFVSRLGVEVSADFHTELTRLTDLVHKGEGALENPELMHISKMLSQSAIRASLHIAALDSLRNPEPAPDTPEAPAAPAQPIITKGALMTLAGVARYTGPVQVALKCMITDGEQEMPGMVMTEFMVGRIPTVEEVQAAINHIQRDVLPGQPGNIHRICTPEEVWKTMCLTMWGVGDIPMPASYVDGSLPFLPVVAIVPAVVDGDTLKVDGIDKGDGSSPEYVIYQQVEPDADGSLVWEHAYIPKELADAIIAAIKADGCTFCKDVYITVSMPPDLAHHPV